MRLFAFIYKFLSLTNPLSRFFSMVTSHLMVAFTLSEFCYFRLHNEWKERQSNTDGHKYHGNYSSCHFAPYKYPVDAYDLPPVKRNVKHQQR